MDVKSKEVFYDKLTYIYVELANFHHSLDDCDTILDKWIYCLKNLQNLMSRPSALQERVFRSLFHTAEISQLTTEDLRAYELSVNAYRDIKNGIDAAKKEGMEKGMEKGIAIGTEKGIAIGTKNKAVEIARNMAREGIPSSIISKVTGLSVEEIDALN